MLKFSTWLDKYLFKNIYPKLNMYVAKGAKKHMGQLRLHNNFLFTLFHMHITLFKNITIIIGVTTTLHVYLDTLSKKIKLSNNIRHEARTINPMLDSLEQWFFRSDIM